MPPQREPRLGGGGGRNATGQRGVVLELDLEVAEVGVHVGIHEREHQHAAEQPLAPQDLIELGVVRAHRGHLVVVVTLGTGLVDCLLKRIEILVVVRDPDDDARLQRELAAAYERVGEVLGGSSGGNLGDAPGAVAAQKKALRIREVLAAANPRDPQARQQHEHEE